MVANEVIEHGVGGRRLTERETGCFFAMKSYWESNINKSVDREEWRMDEDPFGVERGDDD